ncbi:hypothetical protein TARUN_2557 [Trichoderma arundinaceum]|uniref:Uncharacterized protein n=1 Tax=Trichoderma arundinaceum TaxID=490622 RepID=A0A395NUD0_TRIAR|nr:hypothetical protein TARUN_2557 [Trichoderma arundinaceum]
MNDSVDNAEQTFKRFVNRLAQVCDNVRGKNGNTVSSIAVLEEPEGIHYIVGSNNRRGAKLQEVEDFIKQLLEIVAKSRTAGGVSPVRSEALWHILKFDENRVEFYLASTMKHLGGCISDYDRRHTELPLASEASKFRNQLFQLKELIKFAEDDKLEESQYFAECERLFVFIHLLQRLNFGDSISEQAEDGQINRESWKELRHFVGRLHSYYLSVDTLIRASRRWDRLCHDFNVTAIPSAVVMPHPLSNKRPTAYDILGRMTSSDEMMAKYRSQAAELQQNGLDEKILMECNNSSQTHMVHAEVLVLDYVLNYLRESDDAKFWSNWRYIGSSKPTCRLCNYYFTAHSSGVQVRESHNNLYPHWRAPDVFDNNTMNMMESLLNAVIKKTRTDAIRSLESQTSQGRVHDSNSFSASLRTETASISELVSGIADLGIPDTIPEDKEEDGRTTFRETRDQEEEDVIVFRGRKYLSH